MKKSFLVLALVLALMMVGSVALADARDINKVTASETPSELIANIIPQLEIENPGLITLEIKWQNPMLTFVNDGGNFVINTPAKVDFTLINNSEAGTTEIKDGKFFDGSLGIEITDAVFRSTKDLYSQGVEGVVTKADNFVLSNVDPDNVDTGSFAFTYQKDEAGTTPAYASPPTKSQVQADLTADVTFKITPQLG